MMGQDKQNITELVRELIKIELAKRQTTGKGGNTLITSEGDILISTQGTHKAYYNGVEIGGSHIDSNGKIWLNSAHTAWMIINANGTLEFHVSGGIQEVPTS